MNIENVQKELCERKIDGWLFCDFRRRDEIAYRILGLDKSKHYSRRWYYYVPARGEPRKLVHNIESDVLDTLPGIKRTYIQWQQQHTLLHEILFSAKRVAMQYSPMNAIPYISLVDAGTVELVRSFGVEVISSADLVQLFESCISTEAYKMHCDAGNRIHKILNLCWKEIKKSIENFKVITEYDLQQFILKEFDKAGLVCEDMLPIVAANENSGNPHYEPSASRNRVINRGDFLLIDLWGKLSKPGSVYYDVTWVGVVADDVPHKYGVIFDIVKQARDIGVSYIEEKFQAGESIYGWQVDDAVRGFILRKGYGNNFLHRTGHSIGESVHGNGANIDNLETKDERMLLPGNLFSIEPGIYLDEFGVRTEINVYISNNKMVIVTGPKQEQIIPILE